MLGSIHDCNSNNWSVSVPDYFMKPNIKFILSGDFKQLSPVNDVYESGNYENSPALFELSDGHRRTLRH